MGYRQAIFQWYNLIPLGIFCIIFPIHLYLKLQVPYITGDRVVIKSCLSEEPRLQAGAQSFKVEGIYVKSLDTVRYTYGDCLQITGTLRERVIWGVYKRFYLINQDIKKIDFQAVPYKQENIFQSAFFFLKKQAVLLRMSLRSIYQSIFSAPQSQLLSGIMLGTREDYSHEFFQALKRSGTLHIVAASGMNLVLFIGPSLLILSKLFSRKRAILLIYIMIYFYTLISGLQASIVRAAIMLSLVYLGQLFGRGGNNVRILLLTAGLMLIFSPLSMFDIGFWLSLSATSGLMFLSLGIEGLFTRFKFLNQGFFSFFELKSSFIETSAAYLATLPVILLVFGQTNPLSFLPNIFILFLIPYIMIIGGAVAILAWFYLPLAVLFGQILWPALTYMIGVIKFFGNIINTSFSIPDLGYFVLVFIFSYYFVLFKILVKSNEK